MDQYFKSIIQQCGSGFPLYREVRLSSLLHPAGERTTLLVLARRLLFSLRQNETDSLARLMFQSAEFVETKITLAGELSNAKQRLCEEVSAVAEQFFMAHIRLLDLARWVPSCKACWVDDIY